MRIYLNDFEKNRNPLKEKVWFPLRKRPDVPYIALDVKVIKRERRFVGETFTWSKAIRFLDSVLTFSFCNKKRET